MGNVLADGQHMTIGAVARRVGVPASTLRYYESVGILPPAARVSGQRRYDGSVFGVLELIGLAQDAGFTIAEIRHLLTGFTGGTPASSRWQVMARKKRDDVRRRIERAKEMDRVLDALLSCECSELTQCVRRCNPPHRQRSAASLGTVSSRGRRPNDACC
jgi:MerR family redox-sensitive transcriptional activator SoxR